MAPLVPTPSSPHPLAPRRRSALDRADADLVAELVTALEALVDPVTRGDPMSPLRWTSKSTRKLAEELATRGYALNPQKVGQLHSIPVARAKNSSAVDLFTSCVRSSDRWLQEKPGNLFEKPPMAYGRNGADRSDEAANWKHDKKAQPN